MSVCVVSGVRGFGKEQSKCFWIEDYRPARSRERDSRSLRSARGKVGRGLMRSRCSAEEDEEEGGRAEGKGWRGRETVRVHLRITILIQNSLASASLIPPLFSSLASFYTLNDTTLTFLQIFSRVPTQEKSTRCL